MSLSTSSTQAVLPSLFAFDANSCAGGVAGADRPVIAAAQSAHRAIFQTAQALLKFLEAGKRVDAKVLRATMEAAFGGSDAEGHWLWKDAYEAAETAQVLFVAKYGAAMRRQSQRDKAGSAASFLTMLERLAGLVGTQTPRSEESQKRQQFSTPLPLAFVAAEAAGISAGDLVLEPSAGTGMMAVFARIAGARLMLNEYAELRAKLLEQSFGTNAVTRFDAATIHDRLDAGLVPSLVVMNPPFSATPGVEGRFKSTTARHVRSALLRVAPEGRLVVVTGEGFGPTAPACRETFRDLQTIGRVVFTAGIAGKAFAANGTTIETRLTVVDKVPAEVPARFAGCQAMASDAADLLRLIQANCPQRLAAPVGDVPVVTVEPDGNGAPTSSSSSRSGSASVVESVAVLRERARSETRELELAASRHVLDTAETAEVSYLPRAWAASQAALTASLYERYELQSIEIECDGNAAVSHPTTLVQSAAMASVALPVPSYRPILPVSLIRDGHLSDAQIESVIYAGEAHATFLSGAWTHDAETGILVAAAEGAEGNANCFKLRRGWFLGDGTARLGNLMTRRRPRS